MADGYPSLQPLHFAVLHSPLQSDGGLYGSRCIEFLFGTKTIRPFMIVYSLVAILGATVDLGLLWSIAETFNGLMSIPNLLAVFLLSGNSCKAHQRIFRSKKS